MSCARTSVGEYVNTCRGFRIKRSAEQCLREKAHARCEWAKLFWWGMCARFISTASLRLWNFPESRRTYPGAAERIKREIRSILQFQIAASPGTALQLPAAVIVHSVGKYSHNSRPNPARALKRVIIYIISCRQTCCVIIAKFNEDY